MNQREREKCSVVKPCILEHQQKIPLLLRLPHPLSSSHSPPSSPTPPLSLPSSLQGSEDDRRWVTLKSHDDDQSIAAKGFSTHTFPVGWQALYFRHFRLIQTGPTSDGGFTMAVGGFEVYGSLRDLRDRRGRAERRPRGTTRNVAHSFPMGK